jgi:hypothetical protein
VVKTDELLKYNRVVNRISHDLGTIAFMKIRSLLSPAFVALTFLVLTGCAGLPSEKRHSPTEIAAYLPRDFVAPIASASGEQMAVSEAMSRMRVVLAQPPGSDTNEGLPNVLWDVVFFNVGSPERDQARAHVLAVLPTLAQKPQPYQRGTLSGAYSLYPQESAPYMKALLEQISTPREYAMAAYTWLRADSSATVRETILAITKNRFVEATSEPRLRALIHTLTVDLAAERAQRPPLVDLLAAPIRQGHPVIYSFQRSDRQRYGLAVVRGADGRFLRNADGGLFNIAHLANAITNLPGTITNGNTPRGIFTIVGSGTAKSEWIGPTPYLESKIPIEAKVAEFEHQANVAGEWDEIRYESFLPASWRNYFPMKEAFLAGLAGRDEMLLHGTTINSEFYRGAKFYPGTPSAGCLVAGETWAKVDGIMQKSDQLDLVKAFTRDGLDRGYLVVVELDDRDVPVTLADVQADLDAAQKIISSK